MGLDPAHHLDAVHARHREVEEHHVEALALQEVHCFLAVGRGEGLMSGPLDEPAEDVPDVLVVIDDEETKLSSLPTHESRLVKLAEVGATSRNPAIL